MGRLLTPQRLLRIAKRWEENMDATATVLPQIQTPVDGGVVLISYPEIDDSLTTYKCRIQAASAPAEESVADQERGKIMWEVQLPVESRVVPTDRLWVVGVDAKNGAYSRLIEVTGPTGPRTWEAVRIVRGFEVFP